MKIISNKTRNKIGTPAYILTVMLMLVITVGNTQSTAYGLWTGVITSNGLDLAIDIEIDTADKVALLSIPIQGLSDIKSSSFQMSGDTVTIGYEMFRAEYVGVLDQTQDTINGQWNQGASVALQMVRTKSKTKFLRPQTPQPPYPYKISDHIVHNAAADVNLAGTLTMPTGDGPYPLAVLVSGSGRQDRNSKILGHEPFLLLSDYLTRSGIAVLRYDDRGVGESTGTHSMATSADLATDAAAVLQYARALPMIDSTKVGFIGHSEGGLIASKIAADIDGVGFVVSLAGPGIPITRLMTNQNLAIYKQNGMSPEGLKIAKDQLPIIYGIVNQDQEPRAIFDTLISVVHGYYDMLPESDQPLLGPNKASYYMSLSQAFFSPWFRYFLAYDPTESWQQVSCPVLAINGDKDIQVDGATNLHAIESNLKIGGNTRSEIRLLDGLNHLMQPCHVCNLGEYATIETTMDVQVLEIVRNFILSL